MVTDRTLQIPFAFYQKTYAYKVPQEFLKNETKAALYLILIHCPQFFGYVFFSKIFLIRHFTYRINIFTSWKLQISSWKNVTP